MFRRWQDWAERMAFHPTPLKRIASEIDVCAGLRSDTGRVPLKKERPCNRASIRSPSRPNPSQAPYSPYPCPPQVDHLRYHWRWEIYSERNVVRYDPLSGRPVNNLAHLP